MGAGFLIEQLNRYVYLTLAEQSVFVTAVAIRTDPAKSTLEVANAGHPPVLLRRVSGAIETYGASATVLGAQDPKEYFAKPTTVTFAPGDALIAFTDGVTEARSPDGRMFGVEGVRGVIEAGRPDPNRRWAQLIAQSVEKHRPGKPTDDTLIVELYRCSSGGVA
jgi:serine phosphatase RsbU (regulator of sigma subunit)